MDESIQYYVKSYVYVMDSNVIKNNNFLEVVEFDFGNFQFYFISFWIVIYVNI